MINSLLGIGRTGLNPWVCNNAREHVYWSFHDHDGESGGAADGLCGPHESTTRLRDRRLSAKASSAREASPLPAPYVSHAITVLIHSVWLGFGPCRYPCHDRSSCQRYRSIPYLWNQHCIGWRAATLIEVFVEILKYHYSHRPLHHSLIAVTRVLKHLLTIVVIVADQLEILEGY